MISKPLHCQRGATLVVALIMLVLLTLFAISAMNASNTSLKIASNTQTRAEVTAAVQQEIDKAMSVAFTVAGAFTPGNKPVDINNDGAVDYNVNVAAPRCISGVVVANADPLLDVDATSLKCKVSSATGLSLCSQTRWDIGASATDPISGASVTIHQGVGILVRTATCS